MFGQRRTPARAQPRATATRAKINYAYRAAISNGLEDFRLDGAVDV
jgi:hypothetical protein